jgi:hypothetical protein
MTGNLQNDLLLQIQEQQVENARILGKIAADVEALAGPKGRVSKLENHETRNFWVSIAIAPALALAHGIARKLGVNI